MYANMTHAIGGAGIGLLVASTRKGGWKGLTSSPSTLCSLLVGVVDVAVVVGVVVEDGVV